MDVHTNLVLKQPQKPRPESRLDDRGFGDSQSGAGSARLHPLPLSRSAPPALIGEVDLR